MRAIMSLQASGPEISSPIASSSRFAGKHVHFIGIGGSGMSGLARMLLDAGAIISGSEPRPNAQTDELGAHGACIWQEQNGDGISSSIDLIVRTAAVVDANPEFAAARKLDLPHLKYAELLGQVMLERLGVAIAGTHGKSTTTAMTAFALIACGADPSFVVGGTVKQLGGGSRSGRGKAFVAEACEYDRSFHNLHPTVACITNIEADHLDCYKDLDDIIASFSKFAGLVPENGLILANGADANVARALTGVKAPVQTVAVDKPAYWSIRSLFEEKGCGRGELLREGRPIAMLRMATPGAHTLFDGAMAVAACAACGVSPDRAAAALSTFEGVDRRMTEMGQFNGATVVDDYGHHPTEIRVTLAALKSRYEPRRLICIFQPHQASRTRLLFDEFAACFASADEAILADIYFVRDSDEERARVNSKSLVEAICAQGTNARHIPDFRAIFDYVQKEARPGDLIVTMGAGPVWEIGRDLVANDPANNEQRDRTLDSAISSAGPGQAARQFG